MLTHLPIKSGDPVAAFLIAISPSAASGSAPCYSNERGAPLTTAIFGVYNDYGAIEEIDQRSEALAMSFLPLDELQGRKGGDFTMSATASLSEICADGAERGDLILQSHAREEQVGLALVHRAAYDALVAVEGAATPAYGPDMEVTALARAQAEAEQMVAQLKPKASMAKGNPFAGGADELSAMLVSLMNHGEKAHLFKDGSSSAAHAKSRLNNGPAVAAACLDQGSRLALIEMRLFCDGLSSARMDWQLSPGAGSQDDGYQAQLAVARCAVSMGEALERQKQAERAEHLAWEAERERELAAKKEAAGKAPKAKKGKN